LLRLFDFLVAQQRSKKRPSLLPAVIHAFYLSVEFLYSGLR